MGDFPNTFQSTPINCEVRKLFEKVRCEVTRQGVINIKTQTEPARVTYNTEVSLYRKTSLSEERKEWNRIGMHGRNLQEEQIKIITV